MWAVSGTASSADVRNCVESSHHPTHGRRCIQAARNNRIACLEQLILPAASLPQTRTPPHSCTRRASADAPVQSLALHWRTLLHRAPGHGQSAAASRFGRCDRRLGTANSGTANSVRSERGAGAPGFGPSSVRGSPACSGEGRGRRRRRGSHVRCRRSSELNSRTRRNRGQSGGSPRWRESGKNSDLAETGMLVSSQSCGEEPHGRDPRYASQLVLVAPRSNLHSPCHSGLFPPSPLANEPQGLASTGAGS